MKFLFSLLIIIIIPIFCFLPGGQASAQITIEEKVEIDPKSNIIFPNDPTSSHTITAVVEWDTTGGTHNFLRARMNMINVCTAETLLTDYIYDGHIELTMSSSDAVRFEVNTFTEGKDPPPNQSWSPLLFGHSMKIYADGVLVYENPNFSTIGNTSVLYWRSNLNLHISSYSWNNYENALCFGESALTRVTDDEDCQPALWNASQDIQVTILEGAENTSFYYGGNILIGDNVTFSTDVHGNYFTGYGNIDLNYDVEYSDTTADKLVVLEAVVSGVTARDTIIIPKTTALVLNGEIEDGKDRIVKWERLKINSWLQTGGMCEGITEPPEGTTFDAEITQGAEFGGLVDTATGETTALLSGLLTDENNQLSIEYFADGDSVQADEEIVVKISSSIPEVEPLYISFFTGRSEIFVTINPEEILAGEMSDVYVYWYDEMDSLVLIPGDVPFQAEIIQGAEFGDIYDPVSNQQADYFDEIYQGFKFKAAEQIDTTSARVLIKVSTLFGGGITSPIGQGSKNEIEESTVTNNETDDRDEENIDPDFFFIEVYGIGAVVVSGGCEEWACQLGFNEYQGRLGIQEVKENYNNIDYCSFSLAHVYPPAAGIFKPLFDEEFPNSISGKIKDQLLVDFNFDICYDENNDYWKYQIPEDTIFLRAILDVCEDNILSGSSEFIVHELSELSIIPDEEVCLALENFEDQRSYGGGGKYYLIAPVWAHEKVHKANFEKLINEVLNMKKKFFGNEYRYKDLLSNVFQPECNETTNNENKARFHIRNYLNDILNSFIVKLNEQYKIAKANTDNETNTQNHPDVQWKIIEYKKALQKNRSMEYWKDCPFKEKDI